MRTYRAPLCGLVLLFLTGLVPLSSAAPGEGIYVRGRLSSYVDVTIPSTVTLTDSEIEISTSGRFAGFFLLPDTSTRPTVGALSLARAGTEPYLKLGESWTLYPGGYRLYLLAETLTDVFLPIDGFSARTYAPVRRAGVRLNPLDFVVGPSEERAERRIRLPLRGRRTLVVAAELATSTQLTGADSVRTCVAPASVECSRAYVPTLRAPAFDARSSSATVQPAGTYDAVFALQREAGIHGETQVTATAVTLDLS